MPRRCRRASPGRRRGCSSRAIRCPGRRRLGPARWPARAKGIDSLERPASIRLAARPASTRAWSVDGGLSLEQVDGLLEELDRRRRCRRPARHADAEPLAGPGSALAVAGRVVAPRRRARSPAARGRPPATRRRPGSPRRSPRRRGRRGRGRPGGRPVADRSHSSIARSYWRAASAYAKTAREASPAAIDARQGTRRVVGGRPVVGELDEPAGLGRRRRAAGGPRSPARRRRGGVRRSDGSSWS